VLQFGPHCINEDAIPRCVQDGGVVILLPRLIPGPPGGISEAVYTVGS
jgi:hypothetical protein